MEAEESSHPSEPQHSHALTAVAYYAKSIALGMFGAIILAIGGGAFLIGTSSRNDGLAAFGIIAGGVVAVVAWVLAWDHYTTANRYLKAATPEA